MKVSLLGLAWMAAFIVPAFCNCPAAADLSRGFTLHGKSDEHVRALGPHEIEIDDSFGGKIFSSTAYDGLFITGARGPDGETSYSYTGEDFHRFQPKVGAHIRYTLEHSDGFLASGSQIIDLTVVGRGEVRIGACSYATFTMISKSSEREDGWLADPQYKDTEHLSRLEYSPDLKATLASHGVDDQGAQIDTTWSSIEIDGD